jgi:hypothetical protein
VSGPIRGRIAVITGIAVSALFAPRPMLAQTSLQLPLQFDFLNPGAKSLALGGAFAGLADDATATFANPGGLTQLNASEFSIDLRHSQVSTPFLAGGRLSGTITGEGLDTIQGPLFENSVGTHTGPGFIAGVYAHRSHKWVVAGYRHELVRVDQSFLATGVFQKDPTELTSRREFPQLGQRAVSVTGYGGSGAIVLRPGISVGGAITAYTFALRSTFRRLDTVGFLGPPVLDPPRGVATQNGDGTRLAPTIGGLFSYGPVRVGIVYRHGASFDITTADGTGAVRSGEFRVPNTTGAGVSLRAFGAMTVASEVTYVSYGRLREDFVTDQARGSGRVDSFTIDSATEFHVGVQYARPLWWGLPRFRGGSWFDPDHSVQYTSPGPGLFPSDRLFDERLSVALSTGRDRWHVSAGIGLTFGTHVEFNAGFDRASQSRIFSSSLILR